MAQTTLWEPLPKRSSRTCIKMLFLDIFCYNKKTELTYLSLCRGQQGVGGCVCVCVRARAQLCLTLCDPWTVAREAPLAMEFSRQEYWSGLPSPSPGIFPTQESNSGLPPCRQTLYYLSHQGIPKWERGSYQKEKKRKRKFPNLKNMNL